MKRTLFFVLLCITIHSFSQNVITDSHLYTPQEIIEDILIDSNCINNVVVTNVIGGDFGGAEQSYGYFDATGSSFPFQSGVILSSGRLTSAAGPNDSLSDDDAPGWVGDQDLEYALNETNTLNATVIEFDFVSVADQVSFRYIFASEEYQEGDSNTCQYSDLFGFLIRPISETRYTNIALIPGTNTPVKVTTVHSGIPGSCDPINESYFGSWNDSTAPINFNGQTAILTATADIVPNETYHVKLVIADEQNYRYDSAVFLEAGSFKLSTNLGPNLLIGNNTALCPNETTVLDASQPGMNDYNWFKNGIEIPSETDATYTVTTEGIYSVEVIIDGTCFSEGEVSIEYATNPVVFDTALVNCDYDLNGFTAYDLFHATSAITNNDNSLSVDDFFELQTDAIANTDAIPNPTAFENTVLLQIVYARVTNSNGCFSIAEVTLDYANNIINLPSYIVCDDDVSDGIITFDLNVIEIFIVSQSDVPNTTLVTFYSTYDDLINQSNPLSGTYQNSNNPYFDTIFVQITNNGNCYAYTTINLIVNENPELLPDEHLFYCLNNYPDFILLDAGILNGSPNDYSYEWIKDGFDLGINTSQISINEIGDYSVAVTNSDSCFTIRNFTITGSNIATINDISIIEASSNNSITITVSGEGIYEFSLDHGLYQDSNTFFNVMADFHTVYVRDKNGCGVVEQIVSVLGFPKFFTPNGDSYQDTWKPLGANGQINSNIIVKIYDRFGKLLKEIRSSGDGWNGTFNGDSLPTDDYWFVVLFPDGKEYRGHFALKR